MTQNLEAPYDVAVDNAGRLHVTDLGQSQQVKVFDRNGKLLRAMGKKGGRAWGGAYDTSSFLIPKGIAADAQGNILMAESSIPRPISRFDAATGKLQERWFGYTAYQPSIIPDPQNPLVNYYSIAEGFARATLDPKTQKGYPDAYWALRNMNQGFLGSMMNTMAMPEMFIANNGKKYLVGDANPHAIVMVEGDRMVPVGYARVTDTKKKEKPGIELWSDANGDGKPQPGEMTMLSKVDGKDLPKIAGQTGSMHMEPNGDLYFATLGNSILKVPAANMDARGAIRWDAGKATYAVPTVLDRMGDFMHTGWRKGIAGVRLDKEGNIYTGFNANAKYATPELTRQMNEGFGWTASVSAVKLAKYSPDGKLLWMAGRKPTGPSKAGEMYHFWVLGGLVNDRYITNASEWGRIYFYTHDGFYVDALMNDPAYANPAGPYTFGGETFSGRVQYFPKQDEVWAYNSGHAYRVAGFKNGVVEGEQRWSGNVKLDKIYDAVSTVEEKQPLQMPALAGAFDVAASWQNVPQSVLRRDNSDLAQIQLAYDAQNIYARVHVADESPLQNVADNINTAFKWGDAVGLLLGPAGTRKQPGAGDIRILAARIGGRDRLIAMKPKSAGEKRPERYFTPARGERVFDFVGEVPGGRVKLTPDADGKGYTALMSVPRAFIETPIAPGQTLAADVEVLLSGQAQRGLQVASRNFLFSRTTADTSMIDDVPTEAWLYPDYWGTLEVK